MVVIKVGQVRVFIKNVYNHIYNIYIINDNILQITKLS